MKTHPADNYMLLIQPTGGNAYVEYYKHAFAFPDQSPHILFSGGRVAAKHFMAAKRKEIGWECVAQYNQPKSKRGHIPDIRRIA